MITFGASAWRHDESVPGAARGAVVVHSQVVTNLHHYGDGEDDDDDWHILTMVGLSHGGNVLESYAGYGDGVNDESMMKPREPWHKQRWTQPRDKVCLVC